MDATLQTVILVLVSYGTIVKTLKTKNSPLSSLGDSNANMQDVLEQLSNFIAACYSVIGEQITMSFVRQKVWSSRVGKATSCTPKLCSTPLTSKSFAENVNRAHLQACLWEATELDPPELNPVDYGWEKMKLQSLLILLCYLKIPNLLHRKCYN